MRQQPIKRMVNALDTQQRVILHMACRHNISITALQLLREPLISEQLQTATYWSCPYCPDSEPQEKTAQQLWREAGEP